MALTYGKNSGRWDWETGAAFIRWINKIIKIKNHYTHMHARTYARTPQHTTKDDLQPILKSKFILAGKKIFSRWGNKRKGVVAEGLGWAVAPDPKAMILLPLPPGCCGIRTHYPLGFCHAGMERRAPSCRRASYQASHPSWLLSLRFCCPDFSSQSFHHGIAKVRSKGNAYCVLLGDIGQTQVLTHGK